MNERNSTLAPASAAAMLVSSDDVIHSLALFFGRAPEGQVASGRWVGQSIWIMLRDILETEEFLQQVLPPVLLRHELPHTRLAETPSWLLIDWAQCRLPLGETTRRVLGVARSWALLLEILLADPTLVEISPRLRGADIDTTLRARLDKEGIFLSKHSIVGALDSVSAFEVRGWAIDLCDKSTPVIAELYADNVFLGAVECNEHRADVKNHFGGDGNLGFTFLIPAVHRPAFAAGRDLRARHSLSKQPIGTSLRVQAEVALGWDVIEEARRELVEVRKALDRIESRLPQLQRLASVPLSAYDEYWERFYRPTTDVLARQIVESRKFAYRPLLSIVLSTGNVGTRLLDRAVNSVKAQTYDSWELIIADDRLILGDERRRLQQRHAASDARVRLIGGAWQKGDATNTKNALAATQGEYVAVLGQESELAPDALFQFVRVLQQRPYGLLYCDEDQVEEDDFGRRTHRTPFLKPGFDPDLLLSTNYMGSLLVVRRDILTMPDDFVGRL